MFGRTFFYQGRRNRLQRGGAKEHWKVLSAMAPNPPRSKFTHSVICDIIYTLPPPQVTSIKQLTNSQCFHNCPTRSKKLSIATSQVFHGTCELSLHIAVPKSQNVLRPCDICE